MSESNWRRNYTIGLIAAGLIAALVTGWLWSSAERLQSQIEHHAAEQASSYAKAADVSIERECVPLPSSKQSECIEEEREASREAERNERDLEAQHIMAVWTRTMGIAALIGMGVGIFGLGLIFTTFRETRRAAEAGFDANVIARQTSRAQLRAYLDFDEVAFCETASIPDTLEAKGTGIAIRVKNFGATPARQFVVEYRCELADSDGRVIVEAEPQKMDLIGIAPGDHATARSFFHVSRDRWDKIARREWSMYIPTRVHYVDVFDEPQTLTCTFVSNTIDEPFGVYAGSRSVT